MFRFSATSPDRIAFEPVWQQQGHGIIHADNAVTISMLVDRRVDEEPE
jgi:hypothetical protein